MKRLFTLALALFASIAFAQGTFSSSGSTSAATFGGTTSGFSSLNLGPPTVNPLGFSLTATPAGGTGSAKTQSAVGTLQAGFATLNATEGTQGGSTLLGGSSETTTSGVAAGASVYGGQAQNVSQFLGTFTLPVVVAPVITVP